jgi:hypothetical protein
MPGLVLRVSRFLAFVLLALGLFFPWFRVPVGLEENAPDTYAVIFQEPPSTIIFKVLLGVVLLAASCISFWRKRSPSTGWATPMVFSGCFLLIAVGIVYPAFTVQRCAELSAHASWLEQQNFSLINTSGDTFTAQEYSYQPGQAEVQMKEVLPRGFQTIPTPSVFSVSDLHLAKLVPISIWLGLSPAFCQFVSGGWFCSLFGGFLFALSFSPLQGQETGRSGSPRQVYNMVGAFLLSTAAVCVVCLVPIMMAGRQLRKAQAAVDEGKFPESLEHLDRAVAWVPVIAYHTDVLFQRGYLERKLGIKSPRTELFTAIREEIEGFDTRASEHYSQLLDSGIPKEVRGEAYRSALRLAIKAFNTGLIDRSAAQLTQLATIDPTSTKVSYALQFADLRLFRKRQLETEVAKFETVYGCFQSREKNPLFAMAHRRLADLEFECRDLGKLGDEMRAAVTSHDF